MRIVVTGGAGALGSLVVAQGRSRGHDMASISRRNGGDLAPGRGMSEAPARPDAGINCHTKPPKTPPVDLKGTRTLVPTLDQQQHITQPHTVHSQHNTLRLPPHTP